MPDGINCPACGFWNPPDKQYCAQCSAEMPPVILDDGDDEPEAAPPPGTRRKVKSEVLKLFDPDAQRARRSPAGTKLIRRKTASADRPPAVPGETQASGAAVRPPGAPPAGEGSLAAGGAEPPPGTGRTKRRGRTSRRLTLCSVCQSPFPARELLSLRRKLYCEPCLERRASLFDDDELNEAKLARDRKLAESRKREEALSEVRDTEHQAVPGKKKETKRYKTARLRADRLREERGGQVAHTAVIWPKCPRHPQHSTNDRCTQCHAPVCALCIQRVGGQTLCPGCRAGADSARSSGRFEGFGGSGLDTVRDVCFHTGIFFRSLPSKGSVVRPFLHGLLASYVGAAALLITLAVAFSATSDRGPLEVLLSRPGEIASGAALVALATVLLHVIVHAAGAAAAGSQGRAGVGVRATLLALSPGWMVVVPLLGLLLWPLWSLVVQTAMLRAVHKINGTAASGIALVSVALAGLLHWAAAVYLLT